MEILDYLKAVGLFVLALPLLALAFTWPLIVLAAIVASGMWIVGITNRPARWVVPITACALVLGWWRQGQARLEREDERVIAWIRQTPRLRRVSNAPATLRIVPGMDGQMQLLDAQCFDRLYVGWNGPANYARNDGVARPLAELGRHLELDLKRDGDPRAGQPDHMRGPFTLWVIEGRQRRLVDIWFWPRGDAPATVYEQGTVLTALIARATGRCGAVASAMASSPLYRVGPARLQRLVANASRAP